MDNNLSLNKFEAIFFILIIIINKIILNLPKNIILTCNTGSILNLIFVGFIAFLVLILINTLFSKLGNFDILDLSEYFGGRKLKFIIGIGYLLLFFFASSFVLINFINILENIYFNLTPRIMLLLFFVLPALVRKYYWRKKYCKN